MRVLVTGGAGFIGTNLIKRLIEDDHFVISFDNYSTGCRDNHINGACYGDVDITESFSNWVEKVDVIFHLAALPRIGPSFKNPPESIDVNVKGTANVLEYARRNEIPVVYAGSSSFWAGVYKNPYAFSKWQGEELCKMYEKIYGLNVTICRFYNVYGDHMAMSGEYRTVLPIFLEQCDKGHPLTITGDGEQRRDFTHVDDIVDAMIKVVQLNKWGSIYELGRGDNYSINEIADVFYRCDAIPGVTYIEPIPGEARHTLCKSELARKKLKWKPKINVDEWLEERLCK
tara:strand:+ start:315 stop:1172 length:858 start_codon:yes stop_codon:yes gene_type:complete